jgi:Protein of unknown function (DUF664)
MEEIRSGSGDGQPVASSPVWPVSRTTVIPRAADELTMLKAYLEHYRETLELKCAGVAAPRLSERTCPPSTMSLHGLIRHLAGVERWWFAINFAGLDLPMLYYSDDDPDQDFESLAAASSMPRPAWTPSVFGSATAVTRCAGCCCG